jgi:hypothetical protein
MLLVTPPSRYYSIIIMERCSLLSVLRAGWQCSFEDEAGLGVFVIGGAPNYVFLFQAASEPGSGRVSTERC